MPKSGTGKTLFKASVDIRGKVKKNWPAIAITGNWAATTPVDIDRKPRYYAEHLVITHQPTGLRACNVSMDRDIPMILKRFDSLFGGAVTRIGVMRKYNKLSNKQKRFVRGMR